MDSAMIGFRISNVRNKQNLTTTELARMVGISQAQISRLENGKQGFRSATLSKIAEALGVSVLELLVEDPKLAEALSDKKFRRMMDAMAKWFVAEKTTFYACYEDLRRRF